MIAKVLDALAKYLRNNLPDEYSVDVDLVPKENSTKDRAIVITLLRIEEETSRKAQYPYKVEIVPDVTVENSARRASYPNPPEVSVNLDILISSHGEYGTALSQISEVIGLMNSVKENMKLEPQEEDGDIVRLDSFNMSMVNLSLEQTMNLWQTLKGTIVPFVVYKLRMVTVRWKKEQPEMPPVREVHLDETYYDGKTITPAPDLPQESR